MRKPKLLAACLLGALLTLAALARFLPPSDSISTRTQDWFARLQNTADAEAGRKAAAEDQERRLRAAQAKVDGLLKDAHLQMLATVKEARKKAAGIIAQQRADIPVLTAKADEKLQGYRNALALATRMAGDKVRGTHKTHEYLQDAFGPIIHSQALAQAEVHQTMKDCADELNLQAAHLQAETAQVLDSSGFKADDLGMQKSLRRLMDPQGQVLSASMVAASATMEVAIEAALVQTTFQAVTKLLAKAVAKGVASATIGAEGAPVPVVDIVTTAIAVGGTVWTVYDVHHAVAELKKIDPLIRSGQEEALSQLEQKAQEGFASLEAAAGVLCSAS